MTTLNINPPAAARPMRERVNFRMIAFMALIAGPFLAVFYLFVSPLINGGITRSGDHFQVDLKMLGNFPFNQESGTIDAVPQRYRELDGKRVALRGYMYAPKSASGRGTQFEFVYDVNKCCFSGPPQVQERVFAKVANGRRDIPIFSQYELADLVGVLHVRVVRDKETGVVTRVFEMDVESAELVG